MNPKRILRATIISLSLSIICPENGCAGVILSSKDASPKSELTRLREKTPIASFLIKQTPMNTKLAPSSTVKPIKNGWYELYGVLNRNYVYLLVEKIGNHQVAGYLFDNKESGEYVYGEWFKGYLQVYDQSNNNLTIIIND